MRVVRFVAGNSAPAVGVVQDDVVYTVAGDLYSKLISSRRVAPLADVKLQAPCRPSKIIAIGRNYAAHAAEHDAEVPKEPLIFLKPPSAIIAPGEAIVLPPQSQQVEHEAELVVVIGRRGRNIPRESALEWVFGYTCGNDVTARDLQRSDGQWTRSKGFDTFCPLGPWIETELDLAGRNVYARINGVVRQHGNTDDLVFDIPTLISHASSVMTLEPGDIIMTGTPAGVSPLAAGDRVEVEIDGIGVLANPVRLPG